MSETTEAAEAVDYTKYKGHKVIIVRDQGAGKDAVEVEGTVEAANELGVAIKPKGAVKIDLIESTEIIEISFVPESKALPRKNLKPITYGQARTHLLDRHGLTLKKVNSLTEEQALALHDEIDHEGDDLGHKHLPVEAEPAVQAADVAA